MSDRPIVEKITGSFGSEDFFPDGGRPSRAARIVEAHCPELSPERRAWLIEDIEEAMGDLAAAAEGAAMEAAAYG